MELVQIIIEGNLDKATEEKINKLGILKYSLPMINSYVIEIDKKKIEDLRGIEDINIVQQTGKILAQMNSARLAINADYARNKGLTGKGVTIAVLDTGIGENQDFLLPKNRILMFKDFIDGKTNCYDDNGHGTHQAVLKTLQINGNDTKLSLHHCQRFFTNQKSNIIK